MTIFILFEFYTLTEITNTEQLDLHAYFFWDKDASDFSRVLFAAREDLSMSIFDNLLIFRVFLLFDSADENLILIKLYLVIRNISVISSRITVSLRMHKELSRSNQQHNSIVLAQFHIIYRLCK
jgi:hypothetical protein